MTLIHDRLANSYLFFMIIAGIWGLALALLRREVKGHYWGILAIGEILALVQAALGIALYLGGERPGRPSVHVLYGVVALITLPAYYAFSKGREDRWAALIYGLLCFFLAVISLRSRLTGL